MNNISHHSYYCTVSDPGAFPEGWYDGRRCKGLSRLNFDPGISEILKSKSHVSDCIKMPGTWLLWYMALKKAQAVGLVSLLAGFIGLW